MADESIDPFRGDAGDSHPSPGEPPAEAPAGARRSRDPAATLNLAMVVYIFVTLLFALPIVIAPAAFFDLVGLEETTADQLGGLRWVGAVLLAWAVSGILVLARPGGRAIFVTTGALQMTFGALAFLYSWSVGEYGWAAWYQVLATALLIGTALVLWWARMAGRRVLSRSVPDQQ